ncbi:MAG: hypothetical protein ABH834_00305 [Candidatus Altiarchaeota archaeon]
MVLVKALRSSHKLSREAAVYVPDRKIFLPPKTSTTRRRVELEFEDVVFERIPVSVDEFDKVTQVHGDLAAWLSANQCGQFHTFRSMCEENGLEFYMLDDANQPSKKYRADEENPPG